jgi:hypothetical protein
MLVEFRFQFLISVKCKQNYLKQNYILMVVFVIQECVPSTGIFWTELSCWRKSYSNNTLLPDWCHHYKYYTIVITIWLTFTKCLYLKWQWIFYFYFTIIAKTFTGLDCILSNTAGVLSKNTYCLPFAITWVHPQFFWWGPCWSSF